MKISFCWLKRYIKLEKSIFDVSNLLLKNGFEVNSIKSFNLIEKGLPSLIVGKVIFSENFFKCGCNNFKKVFIDIGNNIIKIICLINNHIFLNQNIVVSPVYSFLKIYGFNDFKIKKIKFLNNTSSGLISFRYCFNLLGLNEDIFVLNNFILPGTPAIKFYNFNINNIIDVDITPNRSDAFSHIGIVKDISYILSSETYYPPVLPLVKNKNKNKISIKIDNFNYCSRFSGLLMSGINIQESSLFIKSLLLSVGIKPVNNIIDVTNFILYELGQPINVFDYDKISGNRFFLKKLKKKHNFFTVCNNFISLDESDVVLSDNKKPLSIPGLINSHDSNIDENTSNIFLESSCFFSEFVVDQTKKFSINTDSSFYFSRGTDPNMTVYALRRASFIIEKISKGFISSNIIDTCSENLKTLFIRIYYKNIRSLIGIFISKKKIKSILNSLNIRLIDEHKDSFIVTIPTYRVDLTREVDIIEEILRIYSYNNFISKGLSVKYFSDYNILNSFDIQYRISEFLSSNGYYEIYTNSIVKSSYFANFKNNIKLINPLTEFNDTLRQSLFFSGLEVILNNINRKENDLKLFEFGKIYYKNLNYIEINKLGIWTTGNTESINWINKPRFVNFQDLNSIIYKIINKFNISNFSSDYSNNFLYEYGVNIVVNNVLLLHIGKIKKSILNNFGVFQDVFFSEINMNILLSLINYEKTYEKISKFPLVKRDISLVIKKSINFEDIKKIIKKIENSNIIKSVNIFDIYEGGNLKEDEKSYSLSFVLQETKDTLNSFLINKVINNIINSFKKDLFAIIRN